MAPHVEEGTRPRGTAAQLQQRPSRLLGSLFKRDWVQYWRELPRVSTVIQSWDCTFKDADTSDYVVGQRNQAFRIKQLNNEIDIGMRELAHGEFRDSC